MFTSGMNCVETTGLAPGSAHRPEKAGEAFSELNEALLVLGKTFAMFQRVDMTLEVCMRFPHLSRLSLCGAILALAVATSQASEITTAKEGTTWHAGIDGVEVEWAPDGSVRRISSQISQPVSFPDKRGIRKAQTIAEEKAKAAIVRWLNQESFSTRVVTEIDQDIETASRARGDQGESWSKSNQRKMVENLTEVVGSYAKGSLRGVMILERGYDEADEEAWVKVGISKKSIAASKQVDQMIEGTDNPGSSSEKCNNDSKCNKLGSGSEVQKIQDPDW